MNHYANICVRKLSSGPNTTHAHTVDRLRCLDHKVTSKNKKWSKNFDERPHRRGDFRGDNVMWHRPVWSMAAGLPQSRCRRYWLFCCVNYRSTDSQCFLMSRTTSRNCPFPWGSCSHVIYGCLGPPESTLQSASRSVQPFFRGSWTWPTDKHTDRHTDTPRYSVCSNRPHASYVHLMHWVHAMRLKNG